MDQPAQAALSGAISPITWPERLGVDPGDNILFAADVTRIAWLLRRSGAQAVPTILLDAFLQRVGPTGSVVVPTFNYDLRSGEHFDVLRSPTITGAVGQAALSHPAFQRTLNPLHSFAVAGHLKADFFRADHSNSFGADGPFALFRKERFTLIGLDMHLNFAMSYFHHVEELEAVPYRRWQFRDITYTDEQGKTSERRFKVYAKRKGYANELSPLVPELEASGVMSTGAVDGVPYLRVDLASAHEVITADIRTNKARSIVRSTVRNWLRDMIHAWFPSRQPSRSQQLLTDTDAGIR